MRLVRQPDKYSCAAASLAMLADVSFEEVIKALGYDGTMNLNNMALGFPIPEIIDTALDSFGIALVSFELAPAISEYKRDEGIPLYNDDYVNQRIDALLPGRPGLITGFYSIDKYHMVAWDGEQIYDPHGRVYPLHDPEPMIMDRFLMALDSKANQGLLSGIKSCFRFKIN